ncbi:hypothetical protein DAPPUDRAFT_126248, partial [Daphnia pulex]
QLGFVDDDGAPRASNSAAPRPPGKPGNSSFNAKHNNPSRSRAHSSPSPSSIRVVDLVLFFFVLAVALSAFFAWRSLHRYDVQRLVDLVKSDCDAVSDALADVEARFTSFTQSTQALWRSSLAVGGDVSLASFLAFIYRTSPSLVIPTDIFNETQAALVSPLPFVNSMFYRFVSPYNRSAWEAMMSARLGFNMSMATPGFPPTFLPPYNMSNPQVVATNPRHLVLEMSSLEVEAAQYGVDTLRGQRAVAVASRALLKNPVQLRASAFVSVGMPPVSILGAAATTIAWNTRTSAGVLQFVARDESTPKSFSQTLSGS